MTAIKNQTGVVLITVLLFLLVMSLLVIALIENHLLQTKMTTGFINHAKAFENAESLLKMAELQVDPELVQFETTVDNLGGYSFTQIGSDCDFVYYRILVQGISLDAKVSLESFLLVSKLINCYNQPPDMAIKNRMYWLQTEY